MQGCEKLTACTFIKAYESCETLELALKGFVSLYCNGNKHDTCIRKKVNKVLGGHHCVPMNMMPNGLPIRGTNDYAWTAEVKNAIVDLMVLLK